MKKLYFLRKNWPQLLFLGLLGNLLLATELQAATPSLSHGQSYAVGILLLATIAYSIYLFFVMIVPEKF